MNPDVTTKSKEKPFRTEMCVLTVLFICSQLPSSPARHVQMQKFSTSVYMSVLHLLWVKLLHLTCSSSLNSFCIKCTCL